MAALTAGLNVPLNLYLRYGGQLPEEFISLFRACKTPRNGDARKGRNQLLDDMAAAALALSSCRFFLCMGLRHLVL